MPQEINIDDLAKAISDELERYGKRIFDELDEVSDEVAKETVEKLKSSGNYQDRSGKYRRSFKVKDFKSYNQVEKKVYSTRPGLTHLLEYGHAVKGGRGRTRAFPHWAPAEAEAIETLERKLTQKIEGIT